MSDKPKVQSILKAVGEVLGNQAEQIEKLRGLQCLTLVIQFDRNDKPRTALLRTELKQELTLRAVSRL